MMLLRTLYGVRQLHCHCVLLSRQDRQLQISLVSRLGLLLMAMAMAIPVRKSLRVSGKVVMATVVVKMATEGRLLLLTKNPTVSGKSPLLLRRQTPRIRLALSLLQKSIISAAKLSIALIAESRAIFLPIEPNRNLDGLSVL